MIAQRDGYKYEAHKNSI